MQSTVWSRQLLVSAAAALIVCTATAAEPERSPAQWLDYFSEKWDDAAWREQFRTWPDGYMRPADDPGWKARMQALQGLVRAGDSAVPTLLEALQSESVPRRILVAQALGYLAPHAPADRLIEVLHGEQHAAVRLYLVDAVGMSGEAAGRVDWDAFLKSEKDRDVRRHVSYVRERNGKPVDPAVVERLTLWNPSAIGSAALGQAAPDFELKSAQGETVKLTDYRGKKAVVLVFIYGDT